LWVAAHHLRLNERVIRSSIDEIEPACFLSAEAYDKLTSDMISAKDRLTRLLTAKDKKATVSGLVGVNCMCRSDVERVYALSADEPDLAFGIERIHLLSTERFGFDPLHLT
jgi:hypothetical protein